MNLIDFFYNHAIQELGHIDLTQYIPPTRTDSLVGEIWTYCLDDDIDGALEFISTYGNLSSTFTDELLDLFSVLPFGSESFSFSDIIDSIKIKESNFPHQQFTNDENLIYFGTASVLRYSTYYWWNVINDDSHPFYDHIIESLNEFNGGFILHSRAPFWKRALRALTIIGADALGFGLGAAGAAYFFPLCPACPASAGVLIGTVASAETRNLWPMPE